MTNRTSPEYYAKHKWSILAVLIFYAFHGNAGRHDRKRGLPVMVRTSRPIWNRSSLW